jgi:hypothetical protein
MLAKLTAVYKNFPSGTVLNLLAFKNGYTVENRSVNIQDTSTNGSATQTIVLFLSATLVRNLNLTYV